VSIILFGPPGSGKGTQAHLLVDHGYVPLSTGELLRAEMRAGTPLGQNITADMNAGHLVSDETAIALIRTNLDPALHYVFDGFPRTVAQARVFDALLASMGMTIDHVVELRIADQLLIERIAGRLVCPHCGTGYHVVFKPPLTEMVCDRCSTGLERREEDNPHALRARLSRYHNQTEAVMAHYHGDTYFVVDATKQMGEIAREILTILKHREPSNE
jgi:adenylate kinase